MDRIKIGLIGHKFMGKAHTHAYTDLSLFFETEVDIVKSIICARDKNIYDTAKRWGWEVAVNDWNDIINKDDIDLVDIAAPSEIHAQVAIAAAKAKKHIFCEKPLALSLEDAKEMVRVVEEAGVVNMIGFNYRRVPAIAFIKQLIDEGKIGEIYHFRGCYQQDWLTDPEYPLVWRLQKNKAGYGTLGDLGAHVIDLARYLVGEIGEVLCDQQTFITERAKPILEDGLFAVAGNEIGEVDVDDTSILLAHFTGKKTMGYFEFTRYGTGHRNQNIIEINGSKGSIIFNMEKMNELQFYSKSDENALQGFRTIQVGENTHPYMKNWWPAGHIIGYGDTFVNQAYDLIMAIKEGKQVKPDFRDGLMCQLILDAAERSAKSRNWEKVDI